MRIAFVCAHYAPMIGGVEKHVVEIATRMAALGEDVDVLTHAEAGGGLPALEQVDGVNVRRFPVPIPSSNYAFSPALSRYLHRNGSSYDVVHAHGYHALPALQATLAKPRTLIFTPHYHGTGHSPFRKLLHPPYRRLGGMIFARAARTIAVSPPEARLILSHFPDVEPRLAVIPNGVDQQALDAAVPFELPATGSGRAQGAWRPTSRSTRRSPRSRTSPTSSRCGSPAMEPRAPSSEHPPRWLDAPRTRGVPRQGLRGGSLPLVPLDGRVREHVEQRGDAGHVH